jgi:hypothetical protein
MIDTRGRLSTIYCELDIAVDHIDWDLYGDSEKYAELADYCRSAHRGLQELMIERGSEIPADLH